jgi:hypothetical protein
MDALYNIIHDHNKNIYQKLDEQIDTFWQCSKTIKHQFEWEAAYHNWGPLNKIFESTPQLIMINAVVVIQKINKSDHQKKFPECTRN